MLKTHLTCFLSKCSMLDLSDNKFRRLRLFTTLMVLHEIQNFFFLILKAYSKVEKCF